MGLVVAADLASLYFITCEKRQGFAYEALAREYASQRRKVEERTTTPMAMEELLRTRFKFAPETPLLQLLDLQRERNSLCHSSSFKTNRQCIAFLNQVDLSWRAEEDKKIEAPLPFRLSSFPKEREALIHVKDYLTKHFSPSSELK